MYDGFLKHQRGRNTPWKQGRRVWLHKGQWEDQELDKRMCCHHIKSDPRTQTFTFHTHQNPFCVTEWVKLSPHWYCDDPTKRDFVGIFDWLSCLRTQVHISRFLWHENVSGVFRVVFYGGSGGCMSYGDKYEQKASEHMNFRLHTRNTVIVVCPSWMSVF